MGNNYNCYVVKLTGNILTNLIPVQIYNLFSNGSYIARIKVDELRQRV